MNCIACECDGKGSETLQCDSNGQCSCKTGHNSTKCDKCSENYFKDQGDCKGTQIGFSNVMNSKVLLIIQHAIAIPRDLPHNNVIPLETALAKQDTRL